MQISNVLASFVLLASSMSAGVIAQAPPKVPYFSGFNYGATKPDGSCKVQADWEADFLKIKSWSPNAKAKFDSVKLFSTNDCDTLLHAVPAAIKTNMTIWAGVWPTDHGKFEREKAALEAALKKHGSKWLMGINVGSEALYRKDLSPELLASYIYDVKGMVQVAYGAKHVPVGSADTWTSWVNGANKPVIDASDVILMNAFPYWQGETPATALTTFRAAIWETRKAIGTTKQIVIGETGWPTGGSNFGAAVPSQANLRKYWADTSCWLQKSGLYSWYWFSAFDQPERAAGVEQFFGIANHNRVSKVNFKAVVCPA